MKFRKKPVVIEAVQFLPGEKYIQGIMQLAAEGSRRVDLLTMEGAYPQLFIETLEGRMEARVGDWIIKGVSGELYPCKPDIFEMTYEPVDEVVKRKSLTECPHGLVDVCCGTPSDCTMDIKND